MSENTKKKRALEIFGEVYIVVSDEPEEHLVRVAAYVDGAMRDVAHESAGDAKRFAVLAALRMASKLLLLEQELDKRARKSEELIASIDAALRVDPARRQEP